MSLCLTGMCLGRFGAQARPPLASRGIVIAVGKSLRIGNAYVTLSVLRNHMNSSLPVELWHQGPEEIDAASKHELEVMLS